MNRNQSFPRFAWLRPAKFAVGSLEFTAKRRIIYLLGQKGAATGQIKFLARWVRLGVRFHRLQPATANAARRTSVQWPDLGTEQPAKSTMRRAGCNLARLGFVYHRSPIGARFIRLISTLNMRPDARARKCY